MSFLNSLFKQKSALPGYGSNMRSYLDTYDSKPVYTIVDMGLADVAPVAEYTRYIAVILPLQVGTGSAAGQVSDSELKALHRLEEKCIHESEAKGFIYAGRNIVIASEHTYIAFYCKDAEKTIIIDSLKKICQANGREPTRIFSKEDREWRFYLDELYPDIYQRQPINHQEIIDDVKRHGDSGEKPRSVSFFLYFSAKPEAEKCQSDLTAQGYELDVLRDMREDKGFSGDKPFSLSIKKDMPLTMDLLNAEAWKLIDLAKKFDGEYDGIETDVIKGG